MISIYTDGSTLGSPQGASACAAIVVKDDAVVSRIAKPLGVAVSETAELEGLILGATLATGMRALQPTESISIICDCRQVVNGAKSIPEIPNQHNAKRWRDLQKLLEITPNVDITWVKGHSVDRYNKMTDRLARKTAQRNGNSRPNIA